MEVRSKYASVHTYYPTLTSSSYMCGIWSLNRSPLTGEPLSQATYYLGSREQGSMPAQFSIVFAASTNSIGIYLGSRLTLGTWGYGKVVVVKKTPKAHIQMVHVPQFIAYTNFPLGITSEQVVEAQHSFYDALYHMYCTNSVTSSTYPQHLLQSVRHDNL